MNNAPQRDSERSDPRGRLVQQLRRQLGHWEVDLGKAEAHRTTPTENGAVFSSGAAAIDRLLPGGGLRHGMLVEWLGGERGRGVEEQWSSGVEQKTRNYSTTPLLHYCSSSAATLSLLSAREACREGGELVVIDRRQTFYPPAAAAWGIDLKRLLVIHPRTARDELWAVVESLRSPAVAAVWASVERLDHRAFRCLQLAAHAGRAVGLLLRPANVRGQPSWADVRLETRQGDRETRRHGDRPVQGFSLSPPLLVSLSGFIRRVHVHVLRLRGGRAGGWAALEIDDATYTVQEVTSQHVAHPLSVVSKLADPTDRSMSARA
jgi:hypothetical protein